MTEFLVGKQTVLKRTISNKKNFWKALLRKKQIILYLLNRTFTTHSVIWKLNWNWLQVGKEKKKQTQSSGFIDTGKACLQPPPFCLECSHESPWIETPENSYKANKSTQILPNCIMFPAVANLWFNLTTVLWRKRKCMTTDYPKVTVMTKFSHPEIKQF